jgi:hypothetical protein
MTCTPPLDTVELLAVPPESTTWLPPRTVAFLAVAPVRTISWPPLETIVPVPTPPEEMVWMPPLEMTVPPAEMTCVPPDRTVPSVWPR